MSGLEKLRFQWMLQYFLLKPGATSDEAQQAWEENFRFIQRELRHSLGREPTDNDYQVEAERYQKDVYPLVAGGITSPGAEHRSFTRGLEELKTQWMTKWLLDHPDKPADLNEAEEAWQELLPQIQSLIREEEGREPLDEDYKTLADRYENSNRLQLRIPVPGEEGTTEIGEIEAAGKGFKALRAAFQAERQLQFPLATPAELQAQWEAYFPSIVASIEQRKQEELEELQGLHEKERDFNEEKRLRKLIAEASRDLAPNDDDYSLEARVIEVGLPDEKIRPTYRKYALLEIAKAQLTQMGYFPENHSEEYRDATIAVMLQGVDHFLEEESRGVTITFDDFVREFASTDVPTFDKFEEQRLARQEPEKLLFDEAVRQGVIDENTPKEELNFLLGTIFPGITQNVALQQGVAQARGEEFDFIAAYSDALRDGPKTESEFILQQAEEEAFFPISNEQLAKLLQEERTRGEEATETLPGRRGLLSMLQEQFSQEDVDEYEPVEGGNVRWDPNLASFIEELQQEIRGLETTAASAESPMGGLPESIRTPLLFESQRREEERVKTEEERGARELGGLFGELPQSLRDFLQPTSTEGFGGPGLSRQERAGEAAFRQFITELPSSFLEEFMLPIPTAHDLPEEEKASLESLFSLLRTAGDGDSESVPVPMGPGSAPWAKTYQQVAQQKVADLQEGFDPFQKQDFLTAARSRFEEAGRPGSERFLDMFPEPRRRRGRNIIRQSTPLLG